MTKSTKTTEFTIEDCRTINDACQAKMRVLDPTCEAYAKYRKLSHKADALLCDLAEAGLAAEGISLEDEG
ncbi:MAG: hypothetical protein ACRDP6_14595 [Actinoallomurus sp.]